MNGCFITFRSVTHAQRGEQVLGGGGIYCRILRTPRWMEEQGCGYCIRLRRRDLETAVELLRRASVPFRKIYREGEAEGFEEVIL